MPSQSGRVRATPLRRETVTYAGVDWHRYPDSPHDALRDYYSGRWNGKKTHLHRVVYLREVGDVPSGYDVHHRDGNTLNNSPSNLELLATAEHNRMHALSRPLVAYTCAKCGVEFRSRSTRPAVHCSVKCRNAARTVYGKLRTRKCLWCDGLFTTQSNRSRCCSISCGKYLAWSRKPKRVVNCAVCGGEFSSKHKRAVCCSRRCGVVLGHTHRKK